MLFVCYNKEVSEVSSRQTNTKKDVNMKKLLISLSLATLLGLNANAGEISIDKYGLSYHLNAKEAFSGAPRGLDDEGQWVYNPGIGITYDFREDISAEGFSPIVTGAWFQDCADYPYYFVGAGIRYRNYIDGTKFMIEGQISGAIANGADWDTDERETYFMPVGNVGVGYKITNDYLLKANFAYVPANDSASGTAGTDIIFMHISLAF